MLSDGETGSADKISMKQHSIDNLKGEINGGEKSPKQFQHYKFKIAGANPLNLDETAEQEYMMQ